jgi:type II secretion system protein N
MIGRNGMSKKKRWFGYTFYCILATAGFLYLRFPSDVIKDYVMSTANRPNIPVALSVNRVTPWPTLGLKVEDAEVSLKDTPAHTLFKAESLIVRPEVWSFIKGSQKYCFTCRAYEGHAKGCVQFRKRDMTPPFHAEMELNDVQIGGHAYLEELAGRKIQGRLTGNLSYSGTTDNLISGDGGATLRLVDGAIELLLPLLELDSIAFNQIVIDAVLKKGMITIARCELSGPQLKGNLSGDINVRDRLERSSLELRGELEPFAAFFAGAEGSSGAMTILRKRLKRGTLSFIIRGTLREPEFRFI